jgi:hypothetical protein
MVEAPGVDMASRKSQVRNMVFDRTQIKRAAAGLAAEGAYVGASSGKYEGCPT